MNTRLYDDADLIAAIAANNPDDLQKLFELRVLAMTNPPGNVSEAANLYLYSFNMQSKFPWLGCTPLYAAAALGSVEACKFFIKQGAEKNILNKRCKSLHSRDSVLLASVKYGRLEVLKYLVEEEKMPVMPMQQMQESSELISPLYYAAMSNAPNKKEIMKYLLAQGASIYSYSFKRNSYLTLLGVTNVQGLRELEEAMQELGMTLDINKKTYHTSDRYLVQTHSLVELAFQGPYVEAIEYLVKDKKIDLFPAANLNTFSPIITLASIVLCNPSKKEEAIRAIEAITQLSPITLIKEFYLMGEGGVSHHTCLREILKGQRTERCNHIIETALAKISDEETFETLRYESITKVMFQQGTPDQQTHARINKLPDFSKRLAAKFEEYFRNLPRQQNPALDAQHLNQLALHIIYILSKMPVDKRNPLLEGISKETLVRLINRNIVILKKLKMLIPKNNFFALLQKINITQEQYFVMDPQNTHSKEVHQLVNESAMRFLKRYPTVLENHKDVLIQLRERIIQNATIPAPQGLGLDQARFETLIASLNHINGLADRVPIHQDSATGIVTTLSVAELLALAYVALTDKDPKVRVEGATPLDEDEVMARLRTLAKQLIEAQLEYLRAGPACYSGIFNKIIDPFQGTHVDVPYIVTDEAAKEEQIMAFRYIQDNFLNFVCEKFLGIPENNQQQILASWDNIQANPHSPAGLFAHDIRQILLDKYPFLSDENLRSLMANIEYVPLQEIYSPAIELPERQPDVSPELPQIDSIEKLTHSRDEDNSEEEEANPPKKQHKTNNQPSILARSLVSAIRPPSPPKRHNPEEATPTSTESFSPSSPC